MYIFGIIYVQWIYKTLFFYRMLFLWFSPVTPREYTIAKKGEQKDLYAFYVQVWCDWDTF